MFSEIMRYFKNYEPLSDWKELDQLVSKIINDKPKHILLPALIAKAYGYNNGRVIGGSACLTLAFASIIVLDDLLDGDQRFSENSIGSADLANMSSALVALAFKILQESLNSDMSIQKGISLLSAMLETVAYGQALDAKNPKSEEAYWKVTRLKSSAFFSGAFGLGGLAIDLDEDELEKLKALGREYGILIQIHDDLRDSLEVPPNPDWQNGRHPLPILFAETVDHPRQTQFIHLRAGIDDPEVLAEAQEILIRCGAISYGMYQIKTHYQESMRLLALLQAEDPDSLKRAFDELLHPVNSLIEKLVGDQRLE